MITFALNFCCEEEEVNLRISLENLRMGVLLNLLTEKKWNREIAAENPISDLRT
jgi:hypothetical protein